MDQFQLSFAGKQINGGGILEEENKKKLSLFESQCELASESGKRA